MAQSTASGRRSRVPLWQTVADQLRRALSDGGLPPGTQLPTELQLAGQHEVSRFTIRQALATLEGEGLIRIDHGRGLFVAQRVIPLMIGRRTRLNDNLNRLNLRPSRRFVDTHVEEADAAARAGLHLAAGEDVVVVRTLSCADERPIGLVVNRFPHSRFKGLEAELERSGSVTAALRAFGIADYVRYRSSITSRLPSQEEADLLEIRRSQPLIVSLKIDCDTEGRPICQGESCYPGDRVSLIVE